jgi:hypothetical protein
VPHSAALSGLRLAMRVFTSWTIGGWKRLFMLRV